MCAVCECNGIADGGHYMMYLFDILITQSFQIYDMLFILCMASNQEICVNSFECCVMRSPYVRACAFIYIFIVSAKNKKKRIWSGIHTLIVTARKEHIKLRCYEAITLPRPLSSWMDKYYNKKRNLLLTDRCLIAAHNVFHLIICGKNTIITGIFKWMQRSTFLWLIQPHMAID